MPGYSRVAREEYAYPRGMSCRPGPCPGWYGLVHEGGEHADGPLPRRRRARHRLVRGEDEGGRTASAVCREVVLGGQGRRGAARWRGRGARRPGPLLAGLRAFVHNPGGAYEPGMCQYVELADRRNAARPGMVRGPGRALACHGQQGSARPFLWKESSVDLSGNCDRHAGICRRGRGGTSRLAHHGGAAMREAVGQPPRPSSTPLRPVARGRGRRSLTHRHHLRGCRTGWARRSPP